MATGRKRASRSISDNHETPPRAPVGAQLSPRAGFPQWCLPTLLPPTATIGGRGGQSCGCKFPRASPALADPRHRCAAPISGAASDAIRLIGMGFISPVRTPALVKPVERAALAQPRLDMLGDASGHE